MFAIFLHILVIQIFAFSLFYGIFLVTGKMRVIDLYWSLGALFGVFLILPAISTLILPQIFVLILFVLWAVRLSGLMTLRFMRSSSEDPRYAKILMNSGKYSRIIVLFSVFWLQAIIQTILISPLLIAILEPNSTQFIMFGIGAGIVIIGLILETIADVQMEQFIKHNSVKAHTIGPACQIGFWKFSRHPNYLGEILLWWGIGIICFSISQNFWCFFSPLLMNILIRYVSLPMMEAHLHDTKLGYAEYCKNTGLIIPRFNIYKKT